MNLEPACETCGGRRFVIRPDGGAGTAVPCYDCPEIAIGELLQRSRMRASEIASALAPWDSSSQPFPSPVERWALDRAKGAPGPWALVLLSAAEVKAGGDLGRPGAPGRGKTKAAGIAMWSWCKMMARPGLWINAPADLDEIMEDRRSQSDGGSELDSRIRRFKGLVVLDDCGAERGNEPRASAVAGWIYARHRDLLPTLITSNAASLDDMADGRIASRLGEAEVRYLVSARDYRDVRAESAVTT